MMKKIISVTLTIALLFVLTAPTHAASTVATDDYWGFTGETVLIDEYHTDSFSITAYYDGNIVYAITTTEDGRIEFAWAPIGESARSLWFTEQELAEKSSITYSRNDPDSLAPAIKEYGLANADKSTLVAVTYSLDPISTANYGTRGIGTDDHRSLQAQMAAIYGPKYEMVKWTNFDTLYSGGLKYTFRESLDYEVYYRSRLAFSVGITLGGLLVSAISFFGVATITLAVLGSIFGLAGLADIVINHNGYLANYYGEAIYSRYVFIDGAGPYFECYKRINYNGWAEEGNYYTAYLEETITEYGPAVGGSQELFESYQLQQDRAYYIYQLENNNG